MSTAISRINEPIPGMFVLIWIHFSLWFQIWSWNAIISTFLTNFVKLLTCRLHSPALAYRSPSHFIINFFSFIIIDISDKTHSINYRFNSYHAGICFTMKRGRFLLWLRFELNLNSYSLSQITKANNNVDMFVQTMNSRCYLPLFLKLVIPVHYLSSL